MSRSFYVDSLIVKDTARAVPLNDHPGQDFLIPISVHSPGVVGVAAPACPSRKTGAFCVCPLCVTSHIPLLKGPFPGGDAPFCHRVAHQQSGPALAHHGHAAYSVTDPRRRRRQRAAPEREAHAHRLHQHAAAGAGARVLLQHVPVAPAQDRDRHLPPPVREAGQDLVPEPARQAQEGGQGRAAERARRLQVRRRPRALPEVGGRGGVAVAGVGDGGEGDLARVTRGPPAFHQHLTSLSRPR
uniref:Uncharacterized protein n=1 Tax=Denticeps clupeoides TaxID=299321 RepID=A0AAY4DXZ5_9TELE